MTNIDHGQVIDFAFEELVAMRDALRNRDDPDAQSKLVSLSVRLAESVSPRIVRHEYYGPTPAGSERGNVQ